MTKKTVGQRFLQISMILGTLAVGAAGGGLFALQKINANIHDVQGAIAYREDEILSVEQELNNLRYAIIQTQQFLSDVSATRAQDGLDDGFSKAAEQAKSFSDHTGKLKAIIDRYPDLQQRLGGQLSVLEPAYRDYYSAGKKMAQAYVEGGPEQGNPLMSGFDEKAEKLDKTVEATSKIVEDLGEKASQQQTTLLGSLIASGERWSMLLVTLLLVVAGVAVLAFTFTRRIGQRLAHVIADVEDVSHGRDIDIQVGSDDDDIADINRALQRFVASQRARHQLEQEAEVRRSKEQQRQQIIDAATHEFDSNVSSLLRTIDQAAGALVAAARDLSANAEQTQRQSALVAHLTAEASHNVESVASASVQLTASIHEISRQVTTSHEIARSAAGAAHDATAKITGLETAAEKIGEVVNLINDIASQTNLLALNATIESARAGEAGKGFAVVANEVKSLAGQTGRATDEIAQQISTVQSETKSTVSAVEGVAETIARINELATVIAGAIEEQGAATQEIARNVEQASQGTKDVTHNITGVAQAAAITGKMALSLREESEKLTQESRTLNGVVDRFLHTIRTA